MKITNAFIIHLAFKDPNQLDHALTDAVKQIHIDKLLQRSRELFSETMALKITAQNACIEKLVKKYASLCDHLEDLIDAILLYEPIQKHPDAVAQHPRLVFSDAS